MRRQTSDAPRLAREEDVMDRLLVLIAGVLGLGFALLPTVAPALGN